MQGEWSKQRVRWWLWTNMCARRWWRKGQSLRAVVSSIASQQRHRIEWVRINSIDLFVKLLKSYSLPSYWQHFRIAFLRKLIAKYFMSGTGQWTSSSNKRAGLVNYKTTQRASSQSLQINTWSDCTIQAMSFLLFFLFNTTRQYTTPNLDTSTSYFSMFFSTASTMNLFSCWSIMLMLW